MAIENRPLNTRELQEENVKKQNQLPDFDELEIAAGPRSFNRQPTVSPYDPFENIEKDVRINVSDSGDYWGKSRWDEQFADSVDLGRLEDIRARNQSGLAQVGAGALKMGTTAVTTFLNGTVGSLWGLTEALANVGNENDDKSFFQHMWDNEFNKAMSDAQKDMEKIAPNYYSQEELTNPWYKNVFTWNFLGDKLLKNAGFTVGALATMAVPGAGGLGAVGEGLDFAASTVGRAIGAARLYSQGAHAAMKAIEAGKKVGGIANKLVHGFVAANGEAAIEAINAVKDNSEAQRANVDSWVQNTTEEAYKRYQIESIVDPEGAVERYEETLGKIQNTKEQALNNITQTESDLGNSVYWANVALLMLTNELEFDKYIKGGYNRQKGIKNFTMKVNGEETQSVRDFAKGVANKTAVLEIPKGVGERKAGRIIGGTLGRFASEGFEEGAQRIISDSGQMQAQARVNQAVRESLSEEDEDSILLKSINPDVTESLVDRMKAIANAWNEGFGTWASPGWEEVLLGGLTGGLGTVSVNTNKQGKWNVWQGGFIEEIRRPKEELAEYTEMLNKFNEKINSDKFIDNTRHAVAALSTAEAMEDALNSEDILRFKNNELLSIFNDVLYFQNIGGLDAYKDFYEELSKHVTDDDVQYVRNAVRDVTTQKSYLDTKTNDEIKKDIQDKAESTFNKIQSSLDMYAYHDIKYRNKLVNKAAEVVGEDADVDRVQNIAEWSLRELSAKALLSEDLKRRKSELENERDSQDPTSILLRGDNLSKEIERLDERINSIDQSYEDWVKHPEKAIDNTKRLFETAEKMETAKDALKSLERLKQAKTLQEVADFYHYLDPKKAGGIFDKALEEASPETKEVLEQYKPFIASVEALQSIINSNADKMNEQYMKAVKNKDLSDEERAEYENIAQQNRIGYIQELSRITEDVVQSFAEDPNTVLNKKSLQAALREKASELMNDPTLSVSTVEARRYLEGLSSELNRIAKQLHRKSLAYQRHEEFSKIVKEEEEKAKQEAAAKKKSEKTTQESKPVQATPEVKPEEGKTPIYYDEEGNIEDVSGYTEEDLEEQVRNGILFTEDPTKGTPSVSQPEGRSVTPVAEPQPEGRETPSVEKMQTESQEAHAEQQAGDNGSRGAVVDISNADVDEADDIEDMDDNTLDTPTEGAVNGIDMSTPDEKTPDVEPPVKSMRATFSKYIKERLRKAGELIAHMSDGTLERELNRAGRNINVTLMQQRHLADFMKAKSGKLHVRYMVIHNNAGNIISGKQSKRPFILLVTPYDDVISRMYNPVEETDLSGNLIKAQDGQQYVVVGALNHSENDDAGKVGFDKVADILREDSKNNPKSIYVVHDPSSDGVDNFIYDMNSGYVVRRELNERKEMSPANVSLKQLFEKKAYPQKNLTYKDLKWVIFTGKRDAINTGKFATNNIFIGLDRFNDNYRYPVVSEHPGKVYLYVRASNGVYIPQYVIPQRLRDITSEKVLASYNKIVDQIVDAKNPAERKVAFAALRNMFVFSAQKDSEGTKGTNIFYDETTDTVTASVAGQMLNEGVPIAFGLERDLMRQTIDTLIKQTNPRISIKGSTLLQNPGYYIDNDLIKVNLRYLGTVDATAFAYPIDADGKAMVDFKRSPIVSKPVVSQRSSPVYVDTKPYYLRKEGEETNLYNEDGIRVTDETVIEEALRQEKLQGMRERNEFVEIPAVKNVGTEGQKKLYRYYIISTSDGLVYTERNTGSFERLSNREFSIFQKRWDAYKQEEESKKLASEQLEKPVQPDEVLTPQSPINEDVIIGLAENVKGMGINEHSPSKMIRIAAEVFKLSGKFSQKGYNNLVTLLQQTVETEDGITKTFAQQLLGYLGLSTSQSRKETKKETVETPQNTRKNPILDKIFSDDQDWVMAQKDLLEIMDKWVGKKYPNLNKMSAIEIEKILADPTNTYHQLYLNASTIEDFDEYLDKIDECGL